MGAGKMECMRRRSGTVESYAAMCGGLMMGYISEGVGAARI